MTDETKGPESLLDAYAEAVERFAEITAPPGCSPAEFAEVRDAVQDARRAIRSAWEAGLSSAKARFVDAEKDWRRTLAERDAARSEVERLTTERDEARRERDLAIAHDRQPYPTAWAYEQACRVRDEARARASAAEAEAERLRGEKDDAYRERDRVVALLARMAHVYGWRAGLRRHEPDPDPAWDEDWKNVVAIDLPTGQVTWHYHDSERHLFHSLPAYLAPWDGHDTAEKYRRVNNALAFSRGAPGDTGKEESDDAK